MKCLIVSGIEGIGRKAYARDVLKTSEIMEKYYFPFYISLTQSDDITDLISKICDLGIGDYSITDIISLKTFLCSLPIYKHIYEFSPVLAFRFQHLR